MNAGADKSEPLTAIHTDLGAIFVSLELSRSSWLITLLSRGSGKRCQSILFAAAISPGWGAERVERRLAAILTADVDGYSRLMERDEAGTEHAPECCGAI
jgi:hypothetical protein